MIYALGATTLLVALVGRQPLLADAGTLRSIETLIGHGVDSLMVPVVLVNMSDGLVGLGQVLTRALPRANCAA